MQWNTVIIKNDSLVFIFTDIEVQNIVESVKPE